MYHEFTTGHQDVDLDSRFRGIVHPVGLIVALLQPPDNAFWGEWFPVDLILRSLGDPPVTQMIIDLKAELMQGSVRSGIVGENVIPSTSITDDADLMVEGEQITISLSSAEDLGSEHQTSLRCKIHRRRDVSGENIFSIRFSCTESSFPKPSIRLVPMIQQDSGSVIQLNTSNIKMVTSALQVVAEDWPNIWYRDEGGQDKCIHVKVRLVDQLNRPILSRCFRLHFTLVYDNHTRSKVTRQDYLRVLGRLKTYIDPESGSTMALFRIEDVSKNHQGLKFMIRIDADASIYDVAPAFTPAVLVRSKRGKRSRESVSDNENAPQAAVETRVFSFSLSNSNEIADIAAVQNSLNTVIEWAKAIIEGLHTLHWGVLGYSQHSDGSLNRSHPYFSMVNPNEFISYFQSIYNNEVKGNLINVELFLRSVGVPGGNPIGKSFNFATSTKGFHNNLSSITNSNNDNHVHHDLPTKNLGPSDALIQLSSSSLEQKQCSKPPSLQSLAIQQLASAKTDSETMIADSKPSKQYLLHFDFETEVSKSDIRYVLAKLFKSSSTKQFIGFPVFDDDKLLIGFYVESNRKLCSGSFDALENFNEFGPQEICQAKQILEQAIGRQSEAVHDISNFDSLASMIDHVIDYQWAKELKQEREKSSHSHSF